MASAAEAEVGRLFVNAQNTAILRIKIEESVFKKVPTPMSTENFTAIGFANDTIKQKKIKQWKYVSTGSKTKKNKKKSYIIW